MKKNISTLKIINDSLSSIHENIYSIIFSSFPLLAIYIFEAFIKFFEDSMGKFEYHTILSISSIFAFFSFIYLCIKVHRIIINGTDFNRSSSGSSGFDGVLSYILRLLSLILVTFLLFSVSFFIVMSIFWSGFGQKSLNALNFGILIAMLPTMGIISQIVIALPSSISLSGRVTFRMAMLSCEGIRKEVFILAGLIPIACSIILQYIFSGDNNIVLEVVSYIITLLLWIMQIAILTSLYQYLEENKYIPFE
ncbi:TPA: hypothetical protein ACMDOW_004395 [Vibrio parahaemolyticus]